MVLRQLPPRSTAILRIAPTAEQADIHDGHKMTVMTILAKLRLPHRQFVFNAVHGAAALLPSR
jgi:hypothetical protein